MSIEEKLAAIKEASGKIRQIDVDGNKEKTKIYADIKQELNAGGKLESYLWEYVMLGLNFYEYDIEKILRKDVDGNG